ncbi:MAG TPA: glycosyltransferase family 39 protein, partial [Chthoniobacterales bacterium]
PLLISDVWPATPEPAPADFSDSGYTSSERLLHLSWAMCVKYPNAQWNFAHQLLFGVMESAQQRVGAQTPLQIPTEQIFHRQDFHNDAERMISCGRFMMLGGAVLLIVIVYFWSGRFHGNAAAAYLSCALIAFDPNFIAHGSLITSDVPLSLFLTGAVYFYWRLCRSVNRLNLVFFLLFFSLAFVTKFSAVVLIPIYWLIGSGRIVDNDPWPISIGSGERTIGSNGKKFLVLLAVFVAGTFTCWAIIWASYGFHYSAASKPQDVAVNEVPLRNVFPHLQPVPFRTAGHPPTEEVVRRSPVIRNLLKQGASNEISESIISSSIETTPPDFIGRLLLFVDRHRLLPEAYVNGFATAEATSLLCPSYLRGEFSSGGFRTYFLWTMLLKTPLPALLLSLGGIYFAIRRKLLWNKDLAFLMVPIGTYLAFAISSNMNIGHRHLLPIYPFLYVLAGGVAVELRSRLTGRWRVPVAASGLAVIAVSSSFVFSPPWRPQLVFPHYIAYFNELAGGPLNGWRSLVDSNIDWGQDLKGLKVWVDRSHLDNPIYLSYFGTADPRFYQIRHRLVPRALGGYPAISPPRPNPSAEEFMSRLQPGDLIAASVQNLVGPHLEPRARQLWKQILERSTIIDRIGYSIFILRINAQ